MFIVLKIILFILIDLESMCILRLIIIEHTDYGVFNINKGKIPDFELWSVHCVRNDFVYID